MILNWQIKHFSELTLTEFHDIIALRMKVFVVEQNCPYQDLDGKDKKSYHVIGRDGTGELVATARILRTGISYPEVSIGRVIVDEKVRGHAKGHELMKICMQFVVAEFGNVPIRIGAQNHLENFYQSHAFLASSEMYLEDNIPHIEMLYTP